MFRKLWQRTKGFFARLFRRAPPEPGRFESGTKGSWRGWIAVAPWILPRRDYLVYVPRGGLRWRRRPLLVLVHGCRQTPEDIAAGTRIASLADEIGCLVLLPRQNPKANAWGCWNWFDHRTTAGGGEAAILAAQIRSVRRRYRADRKRVFGAGLSAGAALLAVLALRNPRLLRGVFLHSAVAAGAASSPFAALNVLQRGPDTDVVRIAREARSAARDHVPPVPTCVLHGTLDRVVAPMHASEVVRQALAYADFPGVEPAPAALPPPTIEDNRSVGEGRTMQVREWRREGRLVAREMMVEGLGHAWSGGNPEIAYNDPHAPNAAALLRAFMAELAD